MGRTARVGRDLPGELADAARRFARISETLLQAADRVWSANIKEE
jgi:hypothetical protein